MPLSLRERDKIREAEILKAEIRKELQREEPASRLSEFQKQIWLLVIGSLLTIVVGGSLTYWWKSRESDNQRAYLAQQRALDRTYGLINKIAKELAQTIAAADDVLSTYYDQGWTQKEIDERRENWTHTSRNWWVNSHVLSEEIAATFSNHEIDQSFQQIVNKRKQLGNIIMNLPRGRNQAATEKELENQVDAAIKLKLEIVELLHKCSADMTALARKGAVQ